MSSLPAAAARRATGPERTGIQERLERLLARALGRPGAELAQRLLPAALSDLPGRPEQPGEFSWLELPGRLASSCGLDATAPGRALLDDLLWLQYCVYALFRIQDDLVDGDSDDLSLVVQTNPLLVEAACCAARHFPPESPFWPVFRDSISATSRAIVALGRLQRCLDRAPARAARDPRAELRLYAEQSASLGIASAGVLIASGREAAWREQLRPALDSFAVAAQIVDDLRDISDDLADGRLNHAAWFLSHPLFSSSREAIEAVVASNLATGDRLDRLLDRARDPMDRALAALDPGLCRGVRDYLDEYRRGLDGLGERIRRSRLALLECSRPA